MIRTILAPATGDSTDVVCLAAALTVARAFSSHIDVLHVRVDPLDAAIALSSEPLGAAVLAGLGDQIADDAAQREAAVKRLFDDFREREKLLLADSPPAPHGTPASVQWHVESGDEAGTVAAFGRAADLIVATRGVEHDLTNHSVLEAALLETGRPLLIPGGDRPAGMIGGTVAIGWKATREAAHAVAAAMPFLMRAAEIVVMTVDESGASEGAARLVRNLSWHGLRAREERLRSGDQDPAETLLEAAGRQAGLLVMGGYGRSRLRQWIFGGFTRRVLEEARLPVLLAH